MINVTLGEVKTQEEKPFPKLMKGRESGNIVLFYENRIGTVIYEGEKGHWTQIAGYCSTVWVMENFTDYNAPITLQNA